MSDKPKSNTRGLGRGLGALIVSTDTLTPATPEVVAQAEAGGLQMIDLTSISPNPHQPRTQFDESSLNELAASIREHGIIQPLIVTQATGTQSAVGQLSETEARFWLVAGERRWRAAKLADVAQAPAIVREASPQQLMEWALVENIQRADLNPLEEAAAYRSLMNEYGLTQAEVADRVGKSRPAVANMVRLLQLPSDVQQSMHTGAISAGHARAMLPLPDESLMTACLDRIIAEDLSVRQTETLVKRLQDAAQNETVDDQKAVPIDEALLAHYRDLEERFRTSLGTKVTINRNDDGSGRVVIHFYNDDDLQILYDRVLDESDEEYD